MIETEKCRAVILRNLLDNVKTGNELAEGALLIACRSLGVLPTPAELRAAIGWLESAGLVTVDHDQQVVIAKITKDGKAVARGHVTVAGVMTPTDFD